MRPPRGVKFDATPDGSTSLGMFLLSSVRSVIRSASMRVPTKMRLHANTAFTTSTGAATDGRFRSRGGGSGGSRCDCKNTMTITTQRITTITRRCFRFNSTPPACATVPARGYSVPAPTLDPPVDERVHSSRRSQ